MNFLLLEEYIIDIINIDETPTNSITGWQTSCLSIQESKINDIKDRSEF